MKVVCLADVHGRFDFEVPDGDLLIVAGDFTMGGRVEEIARFNVWLNKLPHKHKALVAGNHDWLFEKQPKVAEQMLTDCHYLRDSSVTIDGWKIYGSPYQPEFCNWAFNLPRGEKLREKWKMIPKDTDILITHGPPMGTLDRARSGAVGCRDLRDRLKKVRPRLHVFGHIYCCPGLHSEYCAGTMRSHVSVNASVCDENYQPTNKPQVVEL